MSNAAPFWAAIAASFSAITSILILLTQKAKLQEDVRPEMLLTGWSREDQQMAGQPFTKLRIQHLENVGRGSALHLYINAFELADDGRPIAISSTRMIDHLPPRGKFVLNQDVSIYWNNISAQVGGGKCCVTKVLVSAHDTLGKCIHVTTYELMVMELREAFFTTEPVAPGVLATRRVCSENIAWRKFVRKKGFA